MLAATGNTRGRCAARLALLVGVAALMPARPASAEWTLAAFVGNCWTQETFLTVTQPSNETSITLSPIRYRSASFESPIYYGYRAGAFPRTWLGLEAELIHMKVIADTARVIDVDGRIGGQPVNERRPLASIVERFSITHGVNLLLLNAVVRRAGATPWHTGTPRWMLVGRLGAGASIPHPESTIAGASMEGYEWGAFSGQASAGAEVRIAHAFYASAEYKITRTVQDVTIAGGSARTPLVTHHVVAGLVAHFPGTRN